MNTSNVGAPRGAKLTQCSHLSGSVMHKMSLLVLESPAMECSKAALRMASAAATLLDIEEFSLLALEFPLRALQPSVRATLFGKGAL